ncbi:GGDEF domain-containing phosphodiesterase (plasmid) [Sporosarcina psychrophila]|uniref:GGDEF domain-containing phosphodiesterase n=1 Tax=Sporosarcina psychrophila TaxID=1476 RepID=UPI0030CFF665
MESYGNTAIKHYNVLAFNKDDGFKINKPSAFLQNRKTMLNNIDIYDDGVLYYIMIKHLSQLNMLIGHGGVDESIERIERHLKQVFKERAILYRISFNEFGILFSECPGSLKQEAERIRTIVSTLDNTHTLKTHIGVIPFNRTIDSSEEIVRKGYIATTLHKLSSGPQAFHFYDEKKWGELEKRLTIEKSLRNAVKLGEMYVVFQPIIHPTTQQIGFEALIRWNSESHGHVSPAEFIPIAEGNGAIHEITKFVMKSVACQLNTHPVIDYISVNLSSKLFDDPEWFSELNKELGGIQPQRVQFELTESFLIDTSHFHFIRRLQDRGHKIYIDDFGTGYSSISYLLSLGVEGGKLDQFFTNYIEQPKYTSFIKKTVEMAQSLNLNIVIEGIENVKQKEYFISLGCDAYQGYLEARPMSAGALAQYVTEI